MLKRTVIMTKFVPYTHFLSLPMNNSLVIEDLKELYGDIRKLNKEFKEDSLYMKPEKFHLTLQMLRIKEDQKEAIIKVMDQTIKPYITQEFTENDFLSLSKVAVFNAAKAKSSRVLYLDADVNDASNKLHKLVSMIKQVLFKEGLIDEKDFNEEWTLHATIMNAKYREQHQRRLKLEKTKPTFDATPILTRFNSGHDKPSLLRIPLRTIELSSLTSGYNATGFYPCEHAISFN
ncbi:activating signal cointegrator 1 complex subunit 1 [Acrasis kona]|uniref:Activating signal cointegrator 1 complex subunit 1 n=1 Tax=Acrasis kona TaxID=1008807 RepID=A0AAW2ZDA9_9EUKA